MGNKIISILLVVAALFIGGNIYAQTAPPTTGTSSTQSGVLTGHVEDSYGPAIGASVVIKL